MEIEGFRGMVGQWNTNDDTVAHVVTDQGSKLGKAIAESEWHVTHQLGTDHAVKTFDRSREGMKRNEKQQLYGLKDRITKWPKRVLHSIEMKGKKISIWEIACIIIQGIIAPVRTLLILDISGKIRESNSAASVGKNRIDRDRVDQIMQPKSTASSRKRKLPCSQSTICRQVWDVPRQCNISIPERD
jgi:hypothetical protein